MGILFIAVTAVLVVAIALVAVGRVTATTAAQPAPTVFELEDAVVWVGDHLSQDASAQLTYDEVRALIGFHLDYLEARGVAAEAEVIAEHPLVLPEVPAVTTDDEAIAYVLGRADEADLDLDDDALVAEVVARNLDYLRAIGAIGSAVGD